MTLTQLVDLKTRVQKLKLDKLKNSNDALHREVAAWDHLASDGEVREDLEFLIRTFNSIESNVLSIDTLTSELLEKIDKVIDNKSANLLTHGYKIDNKPALENSINASVDREYKKIEITNEFENYLGSIIRKFTDWRFPTLEIGPGDGFWTDNLVGSDPLYLVDIHKEYLDITVSKYRDQFAKRIRPYLIGPEAENSSLDLSFLPENQIGYIFSWGVFDYLAHNHFKVYLESCFSRLRPGGIMTFSYNSCDNIFGAAAAERGQKSWMTQKLIQGIFKNLSVQSLEFYNYENYYWANVQKEGTKTSIKFHQPMAQILTRPGLEKVDKSSPRQYNQQQIARLKQIAIKMNLDSDENIMNNLYQPHILESMINAARMKK